MTGICIRVNFHISIILLFFYPQIVWNRHISNSLNVGLFWWGEQWGDSESFPTGKRDWCCHGISIALVDFLWYIYHINNCEWCHLFLKFQPWSVSIAHSHKRMQTICSDKLSQICPTLNSLFIPLLITGLDYSLMAEKTERGGGEGKCQRERERERQNKI
jgi:hypothetical protein